jgi:putative tricarboxylic transport membrane protein
MFDVFLSALGTLLAPTHLYYMMIGVLVGLVVGILPGLGGIAGMSLLLPFVYGLSPTSAFAMLIGMLAVVPTSDTFTSVLMAIPGSSSSQATILDGFPLTKRGEAARALSAAFASSLVGGLFGALVLTLFVQVARPIILMFSSAELCILGVLGLSMVGVLAGKSLSKGIAACTLGILAGTVGAAPATGEFRLAFDVIYLGDGLPLVVVALGIFALPEIIDLLRQGQTISSRPSLGTGWIQGVRDTWIHRWLVLRCSGIGCILGAVPGIGGSVIDWVAYGHVVQVAKDKSNFGKGDIRGVLAPESSNNAKDGGALIPTLLFGVPGTGSMAIFLAGMALAGVDPGPSMVGRNLEITYVIIWTLAIANVVGTVLCVAVTPSVVRLTNLPYGYVAPCMMMAICFAAFQASRDIADLAALFAFGALGVFMKRFDWPRPAFLIGFVLAGPLETYVYQAIQFYGAGMFARPGVLILLAITAASIYLGLRYNPQHAKPAGAAIRAGNLRPQAAFSLLVFAALLLGFWDAWKHSILGGIFPGLATFVGIPFAAYVLVRHTLGHADHPANHDEEVVGEHVGKPGLAGLYAYMLWFGGLLLGVYAVGFILAMTGFFLAFMRVETRASWLRIFAITAGAISLMLVLAHSMVLDFPRGKLQDVVTLPWPLR